MNRTPRARRGWWSTLLLVCCLWAPARAAGQSQEAPAVPASPYGQLWESKSFTFLIDKLLWDTLDGRSLDEQRVVTANFLAEALLECGEHKVLVRFTRDGKRTECPPDDPPILAPVEFKRGWQLVTWWTQTTLIGGQEGREELQRLGIPLEAGPDELQDLWWILTTACAGHPRLHLLCERQGTEQE